MSFLILQHADVASTTGAAVDALRDAGLRTSVMKVVEGPGRLVNTPSLPGIETTGIVIADARRGRRHQIADVVRDAAKLEPVIVDLNRL